MSKPQPSGTNKSQRLKDTAILIGYDSRGKCAYTNVEDIAEANFDSLAIEPQNVRLLGIRRMIGFMFDSDGRMFFEFTESFDPETGNIEDGSGHPIADFVDYIRKKGTDRQAATAGAGNDGPVASHP